MGLISASVRSCSTKARASAATMRLRALSAPLVTPTLETATFAWKSEKGRATEKCTRARCCGCCSATSSMSMPPMSLKTITGLFARVSQVTAA